MSSNFEEWVGREEERSQRIDVSTTDAMTATLGLQKPWLEGDALPLGWQWLFFNSAASANELGADGHPKRGGFLPPVELPRRMWAGSRVRYQAPVPIGCIATRRSQITKVESKLGKRGAMCLVTVLHTITAGGMNCIQEEQDIVYLEAATPGAATSKQEPHGIESEFSSRLQPNTTLLFRYSALTFNGHRIHYDQEYARNEEHYPDLVVHGPLTATLLQQLACINGRERQLRRFEFRGVSPLFVNQEVTLHGKKESDDQMSLWATNSENALAVTASAVFE